MATTYYTYNPSTRTLAPAPKAVRTPQGIVCNPTQATLRRAGIAAYPKEIDPPMPPAEEGKIVVPNGYALVDGAWVKQWRYDDAPPPTPRTFSKYKLVCALQTANVWPQIKEWLLSQDGAYDLYLAAEDISEDEPLLAHGVAAVKEILGWTDELVAAVLDAAVIGGRA